MSSSVDMQSTPQIPTFAPDQADEGMFALDRGGRLCYVNPWLTALIARSPADLLGLRLEELVAARHRESVRDLWRQLRRGEQSLPIQVDLLCGAADPVLVELHAWPVREKGQIVAIQGTCRLAHARPTGGIEGIPKQDIFRALFNLASEAVILTGPEGKILLANDAAARMFGYSKPEVLVGKKGASLYARPAEREEIWAELKTKGYAFVPEGRFRRRDGSRGECVVRVYAMRDGAGKISGAVGFLTDVTAQRTMEAALRESEQRFRALAEATPHMMWLLDGAKVTFANKASQVVLGDAFALRDRTEPSFLDVVAEEDRETFEAKLATVARAGKREELECSFNCGNGSRIEARVTISPVEHAGRRLCLVTAVDVTKQKQLEGILRDTETKYHTLVEQAPFGVALLLVEPLQALIVNAALADIFGCPKEGLMGMGQEEILSRVHADDQRGVRQFIRQVRHNSCADRCAIVRLFDEHGVIRHVEFRTRRITLGGTPLLQVTAMDLTEKMQREKALRESEERYRAGVEDQTEFICRRAADGTILFVNEAYCRYFDKRAEELIGTTFLPAMPHEHLKAVKDHFRALRPSRPTLTHEHLVLDARGEQRWTQWRVRAFFDRNGRLKEVQSVGRDVTERKRAERSAKEQAEDLALVAAINAAVAAGAGLQRVLRICAQGLVRLFGCKLTAIFVLSEDGRYLLWDKRSLSRTQARQIQETIGMSIPAVKVDLQSSKILRAALFGDGPQVLADVRSVEQAMEERAQGAVPRRVFPNLRTVLGMLPLINIPLACGSERIGILGIARGSAFSDTEVKRLQDLAGTLALAVKHERLEHSLHQNAELLRHLAENMNEGLAIIERDRVLFANPRLREIFGCSDIELTPALFLERAAPEERTHLRELAEEAERTGWRHYEAEYWIALENGKRRFVRVRHVFPSGQAKRRYLIASDITEHRLADEEREHLIGELLRSLSDVKTLSGLLPICPSCKKIRDDRGYWHQVEAYLGTHTPAQLRHSLCPTCARQARPSDTKESERAGKTPPHKRTRRSIRTDGQ